MHFRPGKRSLLSFPIALLMLALVPAAIPVSAASTQANIYLIATGDNGQSGQAVGCGDSLIPVGVDIGNQPSVEAKIAAALAKLFAVKEQFYGQSGLYDSLYQSNLSVDSVHMADTAATVNISGSLQLGGVCDNPRVLAQIMSTVTQFAGVDSANVLYQGQPLEQALSLKGSQSDVRFFPETGHSVGHGFLRYWEEFGGLATFGYPITEEVQQNGMTVQYFQRARFEWHPGAAPQHFDVLLGLLGYEVATPLMSTAPFQPVSAQSDSNCTFYAATGHRLCFGFRAYWESHGGLAIFGYPISEEFQENGVTVQYFQRQRLEYHPSNPPQWQIEGGLLGTQVYEMTRH